MKGITFFLLLVSFSVLHSQPITLRDTTNQYDYIIITVPEFVSACEPFRQHKETVRDFRTLIVDTTQIFAEFDSSATPQDNIRNFISYAGTFWKEPRPKFFLLAGTVTAIPNFLIPSPVPPYNTFFNSDYYYGLNVYDNDTTTTDFYIGRIPAKNTNELNSYFTKVIQYETNNTLQSWMNNNLFVCENDPQFGFFEAAVYIAENLLPDYIRSYFILDDTSSIYFGNKDSIINFVNNKGCAVIWFEGQHTDSFFISQDYFNLDDIQGFSNDPKYFFTIFIASQHSILDTNTNLSKEMLVLQDAGSLGGSVFVGTAFWGIGSAMRREFAERLFDPAIHSIGETFTLDNLLPSGGLYGYMKLVTNLWADPSLQLKYDMTVGVEKVANEIPQSFALYQNYPNPFNPSTTIKFALPVDSRVKINVYNTLGQLVETLVDKEMESGYHEVNFDASGLASGIYLYQLQAGEYISAKKMILLK
jgi:hypothetical protein